MNQHANTEGGQPPGGVVQGLARDDVERKKFLRNAGKMMGTGAAATGLAAIIAACGGSASSSGDSSSSSSSAGASTSTDAASASASSSGDLGIVNYALTLEYLEGSSTTW